MLHVGVVTAVRDKGIFVMVDRLRAEYGPLQYLGLKSQYVTGARVLVSKIGTTGDEYVVLGVLLP